VLAKVHANRREACLDRQILLDAIRTLGHERSPQGHEFALAAPAA
jgi:hypothetical protein